MRKQRKRLVEQNAHHFPVAGGCVLAGALKRATAIARESFCRRRKSRDRLDVAKSQPAQIRKLQWTLPRNVAKCVATRRIAILIRIRHSPNADAIEHHPHHSIDLHSDFFLASSNMAFMRAARSRAMFR